MLSSGNKAAHRASREISPIREHEREWEQGLDGMANKCELLLNVVKMNERSRAGTLDWRPVERVSSFFLADNEVPGGEAKPNPFSHSNETG